jgi:hypothetical protein
MKTFREFLEEAYLVEMRKEDKVKRTRGGRLDQWKGPNPRNEEIEYELEESSTGERSGRRTRGKLTLARGRGADMERQERTTAAIAKKAGLKGTGKYSTKDLRSKAKDYTTYDSEDDMDDIGSTEQDHYIRSYSSARKAAKGERLISKMKPSGKRTATGMTRLKTAPSKESVRRVKDLRKQMTKSGSNKRGAVHTVDIMHRDSGVGKGDRHQQMERGRNFIQAVKDTPKHLKAAGAKKGDTVTGKPTAVMDGEDKKTGEAKRGKLYKKIFGKRSTKPSKKTGLMVGAVSEGKVEWDNPKRPLKSGLTPREKNRAVRKRLGIETPDVDKPSFYKGGPSEKDYERYGKLKAAHDTEKDKKVSKDERHEYKERRGNAIGRRLNIGRLNRITGSYSGAQKGRASESGKGASAVLSRIPGAQERLKKRYGDYADLKRLREPKESFDYSIGEGKVEWDNPKRPLQSGLTPREKNRAKRISTGVENTDKPSFYWDGPNEKDYARYGSLKAAHDKEKDTKVSRKERHKFKKDWTGLTTGQARRKMKTHKMLADPSSIRHDIYQNDLKDDFNYSIGEGIQPLPRDKMLRKISRKSQAAHSANVFRKDYTKRGLKDLESKQREKVAKKASQIKKLKSKLRTHDPVDSRFRELENRDRREKRDNL